MYSSIIAPLLINYMIIFSLTINTNFIKPYKMPHFKENKNIVIYSVLFAFTGILCMYTPIKTLGETNFDFRMILILISTLYLGSFGGLITTIIISIGRFIIGGKFVLIGIIVNLIAFLIGIVFRKSFIQQTGRTKYSIVVFLPYFVLSTFVLRVNINFLEDLFYLVYNTLFLLTFMALVYLLERLIQTNNTVDQAAYYENLQTIGQMAAAFAHEIRNPLTTVRGFIQYLSADNNHNKLNEFSPIILEELDRTNRIITDYLTLAKPGALKKESFEIQKVINEMSDLLSPIANLRGITIQNHVKGSDFIDGDVSYLKQCLMNVLNNSMEAIEDHGKILIKTRKDPTNKVLTLSIYDNGIGMTKEELQKIGLPFYTTKSKGTGIGTMVVHKLIKEMDGTIEFISEKGKWTEVLIRLPLTQTPPSIRND
ncbi:ATP-binding protein [Bacillus coahuilensis]|nr:ATP-binding protein [Bacillus coahuilensis]